MSRERYYSLIYRILVKIWGREPNPGDRLLIMNYAGTAYVRTLRLRQRIVLFVINLHLKDVTKNSKD